MLSDSFPVHVSFYVFPEVPEKKIYYIAGVSVMLCIVSKYSSLYCTYVILLINVSKQSLM